MRQAGRHPEVIAWIDRGVREQRVSGRLGHQGRDYWLDPAKVAQLYVDSGRAGDAVDVLRREFASSPGRGTFGLLLDIAAQLGRGDLEREWALAEASRQAATPYGSGSVLIDIALAEGDLRAAWAAANEFGAGHLWRELAAATSHTWPRAAGDLHRAEIERRLVTANTRVYDAIADELVAMRDLYAEAGDSADFAAYIAEIQTRYARRPSLMAALARRGL